MFRIQCLWILQSSLYLCFANPEIKVDLIHILFKRSMREILEQERSVENPKPWNMG